MGLGVCVGHGPLVFVETWLKVRVGTHAFSLMPYCWFCLMDYFCEFLTDAETARTQALANDCECDFFATPSPRPRRRKDHAHGSLDAELTAEKPLKKRRSLHGR